MKLILKLMGMMLILGLAFAAFAQESEGMQAEAVVKVAAHEALGDYLVDGQGRTLYVVVNEGESVPCTGECAEVWPPFLLSHTEGMMGDEMAGDEMADDEMSEDMSDDEMMGDDMSGEAMSESGMMVGSGVDASLLGTVQREDGSLQLTYNGHPLYYFVKDIEPGDVNCQAVAQFGGTWYVISPSGEVITTEIAAQ